MMFALMTFPILAAMGMAIEYAHITAHRSKLQNAVDAAILFAGTHYANKGRLPRTATVGDFVRANFEGHSRIKKFRRNPLELILVAETNIPPLFFGEIFPEVFKQEVSATVPLTRRRSYYEVVMVLDNTNSMKWAGKMASLKQVASDFTKKLAASANADNEVWIGLVPFTEYVNIGNWNRHESWVDAPVGDWDGCVGSRAAPNTFVDGVPTQLVNGTPTFVQFPSFNSDFCPSPITELTNNTDEILTAIDAMSPTGSTYVGEGAMWGVRVLSAEQPFTGGVPLGSQPSGIDHKKIMLVLTDGENTMAPQFPSGEHILQEAELANSNTQEACQVARDAGIIVFTIAFGTEVKETGQSLMTDCAGEGGRFYFAADSAALLSAFDNIFARITTLRLSS